jgi:hypothetical protein
VIVALFVVNDLVLLALGYLVITRNKREAKADFKVRLKARVHEHERQLQETEDRWQARLQKCDEILAKCEAFENLGRANLKQAEIERQRINEQVFRVDTVLMDPRVRQALG